ncbi:MAG TPA: hypothetical protein VJ901_17965 [Thermoanaerobaculia bacterium]|nr:hypothetical protein [Thermoanaerobaculia bacterium]
MNRWSVRILAAFMILMFMFLFWNLKKQLMMMQRMQGSPPAAPAQSR